MIVSPTFSELSSTFLRIGVFSFGGPYAHIAMFKDEIIIQRNWVSEQEFDEGLGICEILPGPTSSQLAIFLGTKIKGFYGGLISGICFLLPGFFIILLLSQLWRQGQSIDNFSGFLSIPQIIVISIIWGFALNLLKKRSQVWQWTTASFVFIGSIIDRSTSLHLPITLLLLLAGIFGIYQSNSKRFLSFFFIPSGFEHSYVDLNSFCFPSFLTAPIFREDIGNLLSNSLKLFYVFFKAGLLVFGGGLVIVPLLQTQVIEMGWLDSRSFIDAIAIGQLSPGPVVLSSAFIGFQAGAKEGTILLGTFFSLISTFAIFLPSFIFILLGEPLIKRIKNKVMIDNYINGVLSGIPGAILAVVIPMTGKVIVGKDIFQTCIYSLIFFISLILSFKQSIKPYKLVAISIALGMAIQILFL